MPPPAREVRKTVTVLFADVTGSTALGERLDPEAFRRVMARYFDAARTCLEGHGGTVEKFIGDAVMAVFGVPQVHEDDALRAVRAAVELRAALRELNEELERQHGVRIQIRIGVNTGEVVTGDASAEQKLVTGDAVNVAARLVASAAPGEALISEVTCAAAGMDLAQYAARELLLRGKSEPVHARVLRAPSRAPSGAP